MKKHWEEMNAEEQQAAYEDAMESYHIANDYINFMEGLLDRLAHANTTFLETVQQYHIPQENIDDAVGVLLDVVADIVEKHTAEPPEPDVEHSRR